MNTNSRSVTWGGRAVVLVLLAALIVPTLLVGPTVLAETKAQPALLEIAASQPEATVRVIAQMKDEAGGAEALVDELGGAYLKELYIINAFVAELAAETAVEMATSPDVRWVSLDGPVQSAGKPPKNGGGGSGSNPPNTYLDTLGVPAVWDMGYDGAGIGIAVIDSGVSTGRDFGNIGYRTGFNWDSSTVNDVYGHGSHVAGIAAGDGSASNGFYQGVAPGAELFSLKISDESGLAYESDVVDAIQWVLGNKNFYNIRVVNMSINSTSEMSYHNSPLSAAAEILWFNGVVVVASVGNRSVDWSWDTVNTAPAHDPFLIAVGASHEGGDDRRNNDYKPDFSANGVTTDGFKKPDLLAPGKDIYSVLSKDSAWDTDHPDRCSFSCDYFRLSGTSMSAPMVSGAVALLLEAEPDLTPDQVKYRLMNTGSIIWGDMTGNDNEFAYLDVHDLLTTPTTESANTGLIASQLLTTGDDPIDSSVSWNSVSWNSVSWNSVSWNSVSWNSVSWNSVSWNSVSWAD